MMLCHHTQRKATQSHYFRHTFFVQSPHTRNPNFYSLLPFVSPMLTPRKTKIGWSVLQHPPTLRMTDDLKTLPIITLQNLHLSPPLGLCLCQAWQRIRNVRHIKQNDLANSIFKVSQCFVIISIFQHIQPLYRPVLVNRKRHESPTPNFVVSSILLYL